MMLPVVPAATLSDERDIREREDCNTTPTKAATTQSVTSTVRHTKDEDEREGEVQVKTVEKESEVETEEPEDTDRKRESRVNIVALFALFGALVAVTLVVLVIISTRRGKQERLV